MNAFSWYLQVVKSNFLINTLYESYLDHLEARVLHDVPDHGHDLGRELPLLQLERRADDGGVGLPVWTEHMVRRNIGKYWLSEINRTKFDLVKWRNIWPSFIFIAEFANFESSCYIFYFADYITVTYLSLGNSSSWLSWLLLSSSLSRSWQ